jgi:hypothetical protein
MTVPALVAPNAIPRFLDAMRKAGVPAKVDGTYLKSIGFKNSNDAALIPLFKSLGFLDSNGQPTSTFRDYRGASSEQAEKVLGGAVRSCYSGLFEIYPDAYRKDDEALTNWMRANTDKGEATQARALKTFKVLRDTASFDEAPPAPTDLPPVNTLMSDGTSRSDEVSSPAPPRRTQTTRPDVTINITLQIAATTDASIYEKFFASMKKHLFPNES